MKTFSLFIALLLSASLSFAQERNFKLVKNPVENPTNQKRKAMVIGMSDYGSGKNLNNTLNDATDMAEALTLLGFEVTLLKNNDFRNLRTNLSAWYNTIEGNDMAIFYFAGHGMEVRGENYLIPIDAVLNSQADVEDYTLKVNNVLNNMNEKRVGMKLLILDACRDNPFTRSWSRSSDEKGLAGMTAPKGTFIAFAASPGATAQDGGTHNLRNGVFTHFLKTEILKEGASIDHIFTNVSKNVSSLTHDQQTPFRNSSLTDIFYFIPSGDKPTPPPSPVTDNAIDLLRKANAAFGAKQYQEAFSLYTQSANAGNSVAQNRLGTCYANGFGVTKDDYQAVYWWEKAAEQGSDAAQNSLAHCYENGIGIAKDNNQAVFWYTKSAEQGNINAQSALTRLQNNPTPVNNQFANYTETTNNLNIEMIAVQGGSFTMGCTSEQGSDCRDNEKPAHQVRISDFYIGKHEITQAQWRQVMGNNPSYFKGDNLPVENVNWNDVQKFIAKLNTQTGKNYRLPTEAEWEYAARGGNKSKGYKYSGSNIIMEVAWYTDNSGSATHLVGVKRANELGIYDMSGNVWEWCLDWDGNYSSSSQTDPAGPSSGSRRVLRGGSWSYLTPDCRSAYRFSRAPDDRSSSSGFRLVAPL